MSKQRPPIAIVGVSALFPGSSDANGFWRDILAGRDLIGDVPPTHWLIEDYYDPDPKAPDKTYAKRGGFLSPVSFDPLEFGVPPSIVPATDTSQLLALIVAQRVLEDAARENQIDRARVSVILGVTSGQELLASMVSRLQRPVWQKSLREAGICEDQVAAICQRIADHYVPWQESTFPGLLGNVVAGRIANRLDLGGTNCVTDAACASAFSALSMAVSELYLGDADLVISGGVDTLNDIFMYMCFSKTPALSPSGDCRPFSDQADGTMLGEGLGMVALKRLEDAERAGDRIYAVIRGVGSSSDGRAKSVYAPRSEGQARAITRAYDAAGFGPDSVELIEAHGTATQAGDAAEFGGLRIAFGESGRSDEQWCALGSVKAQIGHTKAAAGAAGLFKAVMALHHKVLPPSIKIGKPNPALALEASPFYLNSETRPWIRAGDHPRRAGVSSFGFGGSNFHVALEEYRGSAPQAYRTRVAPDELVVLGADSPAALLERIRAVEVGGEGFLRWFARTTQEAGSAGAGARLAVVARDEAELRARLDKASERIASLPDTSFSTPDGLFYGVGKPAGGVAFLFPGQGSQYLGMGADLAMSYDAARAAWDLAADAGLDLHSVVFPRPAFDPESKDAQAQRLIRTEWAQPAIGATSLSMLRLLDLVGLRPTCVAGHSYGEVTALHAAGVIDAETMLLVARKRGELMAEAAATPGAMLAVSAGIDEVRTVVERSGAGVVIANHNAPTQVVLSGAVDAIEAVEEALSKAGLSAQRLAVATAFHSSIVQPSIAPFAEALAGIVVSAPKLDVYANALAAPYPSEPDEIRKVLAGQIAQPVRFVEQIEAIYAAGVRIFVEVGPGSVLTGLTGRILEGREHLAIALDRKSKHGMRSWHEALAQLVAAGVALDLTPLWASYAKDEDPRRVVRPKMTLQLTGSNYGKPYPPPQGAAALTPPNHTTDDPEATVNKSQPEARPSTSSIPSNGAAPSNGAGAGNGSSSFAAVAAAEPAPAHYVVQQTQASAQRSFAMPADSWAFAYQEAQRQTAEAHTAFQNAMAQAHIAFLQTAERGLAGLTAMASGMPAAAVLASQPSFAYAPQALSAPAPMAVSAISVAAQPAAHVPMAPPVADRPAPAPAPALAPAAAPAPIAAPSNGAIDAEALLLEVVADKTGYPVETLAMDMALEADLGIDSIKRVEILSAMQQKQPKLPQVDTKAMAALSTLGEIVSYMKARLQGDAPEETARPKAPAANSAATR